MDSNCEVIDVDIGPLLGKWSFDLIKDIKQVGLSNLFFHRNINNND
jgi:hypothetical protein